tara:strand:+ start:251 stop:355 length:105 start_codon:yes stop_codon:yes gene_type:complete
MVAYEHRDDYEGVFGKKMLETSALVISWSLLGLR